MPEPSALTLTDIDELERMVRLSGIWWADLEQTWTQTFALARVGRAHGALVAAAEQRVKMSAALHRCLDEFPDDATCCAEMFEHDLWANDALERALAATADRSDTAERKT